MSPTHSDSKDGIDNFLDKTAGLNFYCYSITRHNSPKHKYMDPSHIIMLSYQTQSAVRDYVYCVGNWKRDTFLCAYIEVTQASAFFFQESGFSNLQFSPRPNL